MNPALTLAIIIACIIGWYKGGQKMKEARNDPSIGIKPSNSFISFLFVDL